MAENSTSTTGIGLTSVLGIVFIILKLMDVIDWKWIWVLAPLWMGWAFVIAFLMVMVIFMTVAETKFNKKK